MNPPIVGVESERPDASWLRAVSIVVLVALAGVALRGHIPADNPFAGAINGWTALAVVAIVLVVFVRPLDARIGERWADRAVTEPSMRSLTVVGSCLALLAEFVALCLTDRRDVQALAGIAVGLVLLGMCSYLGVVNRVPASESVSDDAGESMQRWVFRTESLIRWSETTRSDWDRRVRPILARQFEMATKASQRRGTDPAAFHATGIMLFGADLWYLVDPDNVVRAGDPRPGPGRHTLERIVACLEHV